MGLLGLGILIQRRPRLFQLHAEGLCLRFCGGQRFLALLGLRVRLRLAVPERFQLLLERLSGLLLIGQGTLRPRRAVAERIHFRFELGLSRLQGQQVLVRTLGLVQFGVGLRLHPRGLALSPLGLLHQLLSEPLGRSGAFLERGVLRHQPPQLRFDRLRIG